MKQVFCSTFGAFLLCVAVGSIRDIKLRIRNCSSGRDFLSGLSVCHSGREMVAICQEKGKKTIFCGLHIQLSLYTINAQELWVVDQRVSREAESGQRA